MTAWPCQYCQNNKRQKTCQSCRQLVKAFNVDWVSALNAWVFCAFGNISRVRIPIWLNCYCWGNSSIPEGRFSKWFWSVKKGVLNPFLSISMAYNMISCQKVAENTQSLNSLCKSGSRPQKSPKKAQKTDHSIAIYSNFWIGMVYFGYHLVNPHVQTVQNMYGKGG